MTDFQDIPYEEEDSATVTQETFHVNPNSPDVIKVSARSRSTAVAGAIAGVIRQHDYAEVQAIGAGAVNQAVKALAIARGYLERDAIDIVCIPYFTEVDIDGHERTAVRFRVEPRQEATPKTLSIRQRGRIDDDAPAFNSAVSPDNPAA